MKFRSYLIAAALLLVGATAFAAPTKTSDLAELTSGHAAGDLVMIVDVSDTTMAGTGTNKRTTLGNLVSHLPFPANSVYLGAGAGTATADLYNVGIGTGVLAAAGGAYGNTAVGWGVLALTTTGGNDNTGVGVISLAANTTGFRNTSVGHGAMRLNTSGNGNSALGYYALQANTTGVSNAAVGPQALFGTTTGNENSAVGTSALYSVTTGSANTAVGYQAGYNSGVGLTTIANSTFIGHGATSSANAISNATAIGYKAVVGQSNSAVIGGTGSFAQNVGIGTETPHAAAKLDITSTTQGLLLPRLNSTQRDAISSPPAGLVIYNTTTGKINVRGASAWEEVASS
jgi:hypothetical protein